jgi:hypothetical protein
MARHGLARDSLFTHPCTLLSTCVYGHVSGFPLCVARGQFRIISTLTLDQCVPVRCEVLIAVKASNSEGFTRTRARTRTHAVTTRAISAAASVVRKVACSVCTHKCACSNNDWRQHGAVDDVHQIAKLAAVSSLTHQAAAASTKTQDDTKIPM